MNVLSNFEKLATLEELDRFFSFNYVLPIKLNMYFATLLLTIGLLFAINIKFQSSILTIVSIMCMIVAAVWVGVLGEHVYNGHVTFFKDFDDLKRKISKKTSLSEDEIEAVLSRKEITKAPVSYAYKVSLSDFIEENVKDIKNELLGDYNETTRQKLQEIAQSLKSEDRDEMLFKFRCLKNLAFKFNEKIKAKGFDDLTKRELKKVGVSVDAPDPKKKPKKFNIEESC